MLIRTTARNSVFLILFTSLLVSACGGGGGGKTNGAAQPGGGNQNWLVPQANVADGGPGKDGIPALNPADLNFESAQTIATVDDIDLAIAVRHDGMVKIYPHDILDWHEIVNDGPADQPFTLSYCPLTGSAVAWVGNASDPDPTFGVSGLLYNSNLLLYDRATDSHWSQMYEQSVEGSRQSELPQTIQLVEAEFGTLTAMFPDAMVLTRETGHSRNYDSYPYGDYREQAELLFSVSPLDGRLHSKTRVIGIRGTGGVDDAAPSRAYQIDSFSATTEAINDQFGNQSIVVVGNRALGFAVIYDRELADGTILSFSPLQDNGANIMTDTEGNVWDVFGTAVSGPRQGTQLNSTRSYTAFWFAWAAHFRSPEIYFN